MKNIPATLLCLVCALLATTHATLPVVVEDTYTILEGGSSLGCPAEITHSATPSKSSDGPVYLLQHDTISTSAGDCEGDDDDAYAGLFTSSEYAKRAGSQPAELESLMEILVRSSALFGTELNRDRVCGDFTLRKGAFVGFAYNENERLLEDIVQLQTGKTLMILAEANVENPKQCLYESAKVLESSSARTTQSGDASCFPADAQFHVPTSDALEQTTVRADSLEHATQLTTGHVLAFTHRDVSSTYHEYLHITTRSGGSLVVSPGHYVYTAQNDEDAASGALHLRAAHTITPGDNLVRAENKDRAQVTDRVESVHTIKKQGRYNPHTASGKVHVNGFVVSCYTTAVHPRIAHAGVTILDVLYRFAPSQVYNAISTSLPSSALQKLALQVVPSGPAVVEA